jgi:Domain of unknown function (DUF4260)/Transposase domain (DUF772)
MPHLQGIGRNQTLQFPPRLDDYISAENPVCFLDAFVDQLDLQAMEFSRVEAAVEGRPAYPPGDLLKLYLYGYLNRVRSSRCLERESQRNVEVEPLLSCAGVIWCAHIGFDRALGYGLKYSAGFGFTHLGLIGPFTKTAPNQDRENPNESPFQSTKNYQ